MRLGYHASNRWRNRGGTSPWVFGTRISETILASVHVRARKKAEHWTPKLAKFLRQYPDIKVEIIIDYARRSNVTGTSASETRPLG